MGDGHRADHPGFSGATRATRQQILQSHQELHEVLAVIHRTREGAELTATLFSLLDLLQHHFDLEEAPCGLYEILRARAPIARDVVQLLDEHRSMLDDLRLLSAQAQASPSPLIFARAQRFSDRLRDHESREMRLLMQLLDLSLIHI
mgnify:CR=1 FL=1